MASEYNIQRIVEDVSGPVVTVAGFTVSVEAMTQGFNLMAAIFAAAAGVLGIYWTILRIRLAKAELEIKKK